MIACTNCGDYFNQEKMEGIILPLELCQRCQTDMGLIKTND